MRCQIHDGLIFLTKEEDRHVSKALNRIRRGEAHRTLWGTMLWQLRFSGLWPLPTALPKSYCIDRTPEYWHGDVPAEDAGELDVNTRRRHQSSTCQKPQGTRIMKSRQFVVKILHPASFDIDTEWIHSAHVIPAVGSASTEKMLVSI